MGIQGLLPVLKHIQSEVHLSKYRGERVGVDAYVWLHRGAFGCAFELATGKPTKR
jgi:exonuclease-1